MTKIPSLFTPNGYGYDIHQAGVLLVAHKVRETPNPRHQRIVVMLLVAASG
jgi:hypothetical protein